VEIPDCKSAKRGQNFQDHADGDSSFMGAESQKNDRRAIGKKFVVPAVKGPARKKKSFDFRGCPWPVLSKREEGNSKASRKEAKLAGKKNLKLSIPAYLRDRPLRRKFTKRGKENWEKKREGEKLRGRRGNGAKHVVLAAVEQAEIEIGGRVNPEKRSKELAGRMRATAHSGKKKEVERKKGRVMTRRMIMVEKEDTNSVEMRGLGRGGLIRRGKVAGEGAS